MTYLITYSAFNDPAKPRGAWKTTIEAESEERATVLFERFFPSAFLKTIEPVNETDKTPTND
jgi:hypothetical protein